MKKTLLSICLIVLFGFSGIVSGSDVTLDTVDNYNSWGWKALVIDNGYIQLVIMPEIGGRVLHYGFENDTYMAVNESQIKNEYNPASNESGPWTSSWGYGGYKVWPAPQSIWNWPPPPYLDWGNYQFSIEHSSADSVIIYMKSAVESKKAPGLQQARRYKVYKNSTKVVVEQILTNVSSTTNEWAVWEVTQAIIDHDGTGDYENISTYFPSDEASLKALMGNVPTTTQVEENVRKFNYNVNGEKMGTLLKEGWVCFVDEKDEQTYAKVFNNDVTAQYSDQNSNFQLYVGGSYIEIEVLGPLTNIPVGDSVVYTEHWYASKIKGNIHTTNHAGAIRSRLSYNSATSTASGEYGIFNSGKLKVVFSNNTSILKELDTNNVIAAQKYTFSVTDVPAGTTKIKILAYDENSKFVGILDSLNGTSTNGLFENVPVAQIQVFPTITKAERDITIQLEEKICGKIQIDLINMNGQILSTRSDIVDSSEPINFLIPKVPAGIYYLKVNAGSYASSSKIVVQ